MRQAIFDRIKNVTAAGTRVYGGQIAPQDVETPYIVFWLSGGSEGLAHDGAHDARELTLQVSCFGTGYKQAADLAEQVAVLMRAWKNTGTVSYALKTSEMDMYEQEVGLYHVPLIVTIKYYG